MSIEPRLRGQGPSLLLIHGSAADASTWSVQLASLAGAFRMLAYDRRPGALSVQDHADDAAELLTTHLEKPCAVVGSSFGAVIALDLARRYPELVKVLVLCEPPLAASDYVSAIPPGFGCRFDDVAARAGGPQAAELFLRTVLGDGAFDAMPRTYQERTRGTFAAIRADMSALARYHVGYDRLAREMSCSVHLAGGDRSAAFYAETLEALQQAIPGSQRHVMRGAGHMMQVDAHRQFGELLRSACA